MPSGPARATRQRLGDRLIARGLLDAERLTVALGEQRRFHRPLGEILVSLGFVAEAEIRRLVAEDMGLEFLSASELQPDPIVVSGIDAEFVRETGAFPHLLEDGVLHVVMIEPDDPHRLSQVRARFPYPLRLAVTTDADLSALVHAHLQVQSSRVAELMNAAHADEGENLSVEELTEALLVDGIQRQATDIHIEPEDHVTRVRYRIDGLLQTAENLPVGITPAVVSRLKILAHLDISERRRPQDGRLRLEWNDRSVDMRVSIMPTCYGENVVLRLLEGTMGVLSLKKIGLTPQAQALLSRIAERPHGLFLVTGPTGSGKTTTLYSMLAEIDAVHRKVATVEDPIEYRLPLLRQTQIDTAVGFDFAAGLRSLLRQDPDVVLVGEIRDEETAEMAIRASMTGHLVLSSLHTNSAVGAVPRLVDMGIEPYLVEDSLIGAMSQRLVRRVCRLCAQPRPASETESTWLGVRDASVSEGQGCTRCDGTGYQGRVAISELFLPDEETARAMRAGSGTERVLEIARGRGFRSMEEDGQRLVLGGLTTYREVQRVGRGHRLSESEREGV